MSTVLRALGSLVALLALSSSAARGPEPVYRVEPVGAQEGLDSGIVSTVYVDRAGLLWTATGQGLVRFDGYSKQVFSRNPADPKSLSDNIVRAIFEDRRGRFWVGTNSGGLNLLDRAAGTFTRFVHDAEDPDSIRKRAAPGTSSLEGEMNTALRAKSVLVLMGVDRLIRDASAGGKSLDDLVL